MVADGYPDLALQHVEHLLEVVPVGALAADARPIARRNPCALVLLVGAGVRRAELAGLQLEQADTESERVEVRQGKGRKDRVCWLPPSALPAVHDWLAIRGPAPGPLLLPVRKGDRIETARYPPTRCAISAGSWPSLPPPSCPPPDLRGT